MRAPSNRNGTSGWPRQWPVPYGSTPNKAPGYYGSFDYLPHTRLHHTPSEDRFRTTRNRVGGERLLSPLLLYQNYHLVHHLHPSVPFYRYITAWQRNEEAYLEREPAITTVFGQELSPDQYLEWKELNKNPKWSAIHLLPVLFCLIVIGSATRFGSNRANGRMLFDKAVRNRKRLSMRSFRSISVQGFFFSIVLARATPSAPHPA